MALDKFTVTFQANPSFYDLRYPYTLPKQNFLWQKFTFIQFLLFLNSERKLQRDQYNNWNFLYTVGANMDMSYTDYVGTFRHGTNVWNYNSVLKHTDIKHDKCYSK